MTTLYDKRPTHFGFVAKRPKSEARAPDSELGGRTAIVREFMRTSLPGETRVAPDIEDDEHTELKTRRKRWTAICTHQRRLGLSVGAMIEGDRVLIVNKGS